MMNLPLVLERAGWIPVTITFIVSILVLMQLLISFNTKRSSGLSKALLAVVFSGVLIALGIYGYFDWTQYLKKSVSLYIHNPSSDVDLEELAKVISKKLLTTAVYGFPAGIFCVAFLIRSIAGVMRYRRD